MQQDKSDPNQSTTSPVRKAANDNSYFDPTIPGGAALRGDRVLFHFVDAVSCETLEQLAKGVLDKFGGWPSDPVQQRKLGKHAKRELKSGAPDLVSDLLKVRHGTADAMHVTGLPEETNIARVLMLAMSRCVGDIYNFAGQNGGELIMKLVPKADGGENNNAAPGEFAMHSDDAAIPRDARVHCIALMGRKNPPGVATHYAPLSWALKKMASENGNKARRALQVLSVPRFQFAFPISLGAGEGIWTRPRPIISMGPDRRWEISFPSYNTRTVSPSDTEGKEMMAWLLRSLEAVKISVEVQPGSFFAFSNLRGTHSRDNISGGDREIWRTYGIESLAGLRNLTGEHGPIFPIEPLVKLAANDNA